MLLHRKNLSETKLFKILLKIHYKTLTSRDINLKKMYNFENSNIKLKKRQFFFNRKIYETKIEEKLHNIHQLFHNIED